MKNYLITQGYDHLSCIFNFLDVDGLIVCYLAFDDLKKTVCKYEHKTKRIETFRKDYWALQESYYFAKEAIHTLRVPINKYHMPGAPQIVLDALQTHKQTIQPCPYAYPPPGLPGDVNGHYDRQRDYGRLYDDIVKWEQKNNYTFLAVLSKMHDEWKIRHTKFTKWHDAAKKYASLSKK